MSVIISFYSRDCIVIGADRRTTIRNNDGIRYSDETCKIFPFSEGIVIAYCGDNSVTKGKTVHEFLKGAKKAFKTVSIFDLPSKLLSYFEKHKYTADITFQILGYGIGGIAMLYSVSTKNKTIEMVSSGFHDYNWMCSGRTDIATPILKGSNQNEMSEREAIDLVKMAIDASIVAYKYRMEQSIGGTPDIYLIKKDFEGWIFNNDITPITQNRLNDIDDVLREIMIQKGQK